MKFTLKDFKDTVKLWLTDIVKLRPTKESDGERGWPGYLFGGRVRTSTVVLIVAFCAVWWTYDTYKPAPEPSAPPQVVPPGFVPDPNYTWVPRSRLQQPPSTVTVTPPPPTTTRPPTTTSTTTPPPPPPFQLPVLPPPFGPGTSTTPPPPAPPPFPLPQLPPGPFPPPPAPPR